MCIRDSINSNADLKNKYANVIPRINELYESITENANRNLWFGQIYGICPSIGFASTLATVKQQYLATPEANRAEY